METGIERMNNKIGGRELDWPFSVYSVRSVLNISHSEKKIMSQIHKGYDESDTVMYYFYFISFQELDCFFFCDSEIQ